MHGGDLSSSKRDLGEKMRGCILVREGLKEFFSGTKKGQWDVCRETKLTLVLQRGVGKQGSVMMLVEEGEDPREPGLDNRHGKATDQCDQ